MLIKILIYFLIYFVGENLAWMSGGTFTFETAWDLWQDEDAYWDFNSPAECQGTDNCPMCIPESQIRVKSSHEYFK